MRAARLVAGALLAAVLATSCSGGGDTYEIRATFPQAVSLFEQSRIKLMGQDVGLVSDVEIAGDRIEVVMTIDGEVPLPADVNAAIAPLSLIGERNVLLFPAWKPGDERVGDGHVIPPDSVRVPVEVDEALAAFTELASAVDGSVVQRVVGNAEAAVRGRGEQLNATFEQVADLVEVLAEQDDDLLRVLRDLDDAAGTISARRGQLTALVDAYATASGVLAQERESIQEFLDALVLLAEEGDDLLATYEDQLPGDLALLAETVLRVQVNLDSVDEFVAQLPRLAQLVLDAYVPGQGAVRLRTTEGGVVAREFLNELLEDLGLPPVPCTPPVSQCGDPS